MFVFVLLSFLYLAAMRSPAGKELTSWLSCVLCNLVFLSLSRMVLPSQVWYVIASIRDLCLPPYFVE